MRRGSRLAGHPDQDAANALVQHWSRQERRERRFRNQTTGSGPPFTWLILGCNGDTIVISSNFSKYVIDPCCFSALNGM